MWAGVARLLRAEVESMVQARHAQPRARHEAARQAQQRRRAEESLARLRMALAPLRRTGLALRLVGHGAGGGVALLALLSEPAFGRPSSMAAVKSGAGRRSRTPRPATMPSRRRRRRAWRHFRLLSTTATRGVGDRLGQRSGGQGGGQGGAGRR